MLEPATIPLTPPANALAGLSVVLPCFNERANIADAIRDASAAARETSRAHEIIVVDDGSSDGTAAVAGRAARRDERVRVLVHPSNHGYGAALRTGIRAARMPWILLTDADLQFDLRELEGFLPLAGDADLLIGWRILRQDPVARRMNAAAWNWLVRRVFDVPVRDVDCAFKLGRRELLQRIELKSTGAMISTELLVRSVAAGARLRELGVHHRPRRAGEPTGGKPRVVLRAFRELAELRRALQLDGGAAG